MNPPNVTMPRWPAYLMGAFAAACAYPAVTTPPPAAESHRAAGQETALTPSPAALADAAAASPNPAIRKLK